MEAVHYCEGAILDASKQGLFIPIAGRAVTFLADLGTTPPAA